MPRDVYLKLREWREIFEKLTGIVILDPDGFDRSDPFMWEREYTLDEFLQRAQRCTVNHTRPNVWWKR